MIKTISPLTHLENVTLIQKIKTKKIISLYLKHGIDVNRYFNGVKEVSIYQCNETGYRFYHPFNLTGDSLFYQHFQNFDWYYMPWKWEHEISLQYINHGLDILEVGCAHGAFLETLNNKFDLKSSIGLELNETTIVKNDKWQIVNENVHDFAKKNPEKFDVVCSYQVLEHISDVNEFIESNIACLKKGGKLILSVPNNNSFLKNIEAALNMPPHHMGLWTEKSLLSITKLFPLKVIDVHFEELKDYHVDNHLWSEKYSNGISVINKVKRKIDQFSGRYDKFKSDIMVNNKNIVGHTILVVYEKL